MKGQKKGGHAHVGPSQDHASMQAHALHVNCRLTSGGPTRRSTLVNVTIHTYQAEVCVWVGLAGMGGPVGPTL